MPSTINGIGTRYYGRTQVQVFALPCAACRKVTRRSSFDCGLYFTLLYLPLLPLGRRHVTDMCSGCTAHRAVSLARWRAGKEEAHRAAREKLAGGGRDGLLDALAHAIAYESPALFDEVREAAARSPAGADAELQLALGDAAEMFGRWEVAARTYDAALPLPGARFALARLHVQEGRPEEAWPLVRAQLEAGDEDALPELEQLVRGLQAHGRHDTALAAIAVGEELFPDWGESRPARALFRKSDKLRGSTKPVGTLPRRPEVRPEPEARPLAAALPGVFVLLLLAGLLVGFLYSTRTFERAHRVAVVNSLGVPYTYLLDGEPHELPPGVGRVVLEEGVRTIEVPALGLPAASLDFTLSWSERASGDGSFVLNPDRLAMLFEERIAYAESHRGEFDTYLIPHAGALFHQLSAIDYFFQEPPELLGGGGEVAYRTVVYARNDLSLLARARELEPEPRADYLRLALAIFPEETRLLSELSELLGEEGSLELVEPWLDDRPTHVDFHRVYQRVKSRLDPGHDLVAEYRARVAADSTDAGLRYLYGRLLRGAAADSQLVRARELDPALAHPYLAEAFAALSRGGWSRALRAAEQALERQPGLYEAEAHRIHALLALGRRDEALDALDAWFDEDQSNWALERMLHTLVWSAREEEAEALYRQVLVSLGESLRDLRGKLLRAWMTWAAGRREEAAAQFLRLGGPREQLIAGLLKPDLLLAVRSVRSSEDAFLVYAAARHAGDEKVAERAWSAGLEALAQSRAEVRALGPLFEAATLDLEAVLALELFPSAKVLYLTALGYRFPDRAGDCFTLAASLHVPTGFPDGYIQELWE